MPRRASFSEQYHAATYASGDTMLGADYARADIALGRGDTAGSAVDEEVFPRCRYSPPVCPQTTS